MPFDATLKSILTEHPEDFTSVFGLPTVGPVSPLNVDLSTISAATDVVLGFGEPLQDIVDLNFQSGPDLGLPGRLHTYNAVLNARHGIAVRTILVLLRPKADSANLTGKISYGDGDCRVEFGYRTIRLWQEPLEAYLQAGITAVPLATLCRMPDSESLLEALREVTRRIDQRLEHEMTHAEAQRLRAATIILLGLRVAKDDITGILKGTAMEEVMTAYDEAIAAIEAGELRGELRGRIATILRQARHQFGEPDSATESQLTSIQDPERLERLADAVLTAKSWQEWLATS